MDCLEGMKDISNKSIDMILCDLPYGTTSCKWDTIIPFKPLWEQYKRIVKPNGAIVLTASQPFTSVLVTSNLEMFKYEWVWEKEQGTNQNLCRISPLKKHESILVFYNASYDEFSNYIKSKRKEKGLSKSQIDKLIGTNTAYSWWEGRKSGIQLPTKEQYELLKKVLELDNSFDSLIFGKVYRPQMEYGLPYIMKRKGKTELDPIIGNNQVKIDTINNGERYPTSILKFNRELKNRLHPTQKPVALFEYLIKTYTNEGETVLDNCMGSGTTAIAALNTGRFFIGYELDKGYYDIANKRIEGHQQ